MENQGRPESPLHTGSELLGENSIRHPWQPGENVHNAKQLWKAKNIMEAVLTREQGVIQKVQGLDKLIGAGQQFKKPHKDTNQSCSNDFHQELLDWCKHCKGLGRFTTRGFSGYPGVLGRGSGICSTEGEQGVVLWGGVWHGAPVCRAQRGWRGIRSRGEMDKGEWL